MGDDSEGNREVVERSFFAEICWCKVDGNSCASRKRIAGIFYGTPYPLSRFLYGRIAESHDGKLSHSGNDIDFHVNGLCGYPGNCGGW